MERLHLQTLGIALAQFRLDALTHLFGGIVGVGEGNDFLRPCVPFVNQPGDALDQDRGLAGTGAGDHKHGTVDVLDRLQLLRVRGN